MHRSLLFLLPQALLALDFPSTPPVEPKDAANTFHVLDGFEMQLIAAEPLVTDPVAITYDADGRAYVCEMNDYPYTDKAAHKPSQENPTDAHIGKVRLLTDTDGDGTFDKATVFAEGLSWPTGTACWKGGIFVTATPNVWYLKDTNDDGVADVRQKVFTGFKKLNVQAVMNNPIWGLDHRIYIAGGSNGGEIQRVPGSESVMPIPSDFKPLPIKRNDFSFDPSTGDVRLESGGARFGQTFDDWGNRFLCNIRNPCQHVVLPYRYLARNPYLVVPSALNDCAEAGDQLPVWRTSPPEPWREFRAKRWVQEGSHLPKSELVGAGVVTSSSGITVYRGDAYPKEYRDFAFVADVAGNLFYRMKLVPDGVTFKAVQVDGTKNFCTSDDLWFRPVNFVNAPDGCLHVCDMYREVIEHPWSIPDDIHAAVDLLRGRDRGRIWRLTPRRSVVPPSGGSEKAPAKAGTTIRSTPKLSTASTQDLVALLDHPNAWHRETAQRLLFERQDKTAVEPLRALVKSGKTEQGRMVALDSLESLGFFGSFDAMRLNEVQMSPAYFTNEKAIKGDALLEQLGFPLHGQALLREAINDESPYVRREAMRIRPEALMAPTTLGELSEPRKETARLIRDKNLLVVIEAISLHSLFYSPASLEVIGDVCVQHQNSPGLLQAALVASAREQYPQFLRVVASAEIEHSKPLQDFTSQCMKMIGRKCRKGVASEAPFYAVSGVLQRRLPESLTRSLIADLAVELRRSGSSIRERVFERRSQLCASLAQRIEKDVSAKDVPGDEIIPTLRLLPDFVFAGWSARDLFLKYLGKQYSSEIQMATLEALDCYDEATVGEVIMEVWPSLTPMLRERAITCLLSRKDRIAQLLDAIEAKKITPAQLSVAAKATLGRQKTPTLAERIAKLIGDGGSSSNRKDVIEKYTKEMGLRADEGIRAPGDVTRGSKVYETVCMVCHKFADKGNDVGPHLGTIKAWTAEQLVTNILDPNREVSPNFALYLVETNDGRTLSGLITSETAGNLTLKRADGGTDTVLRSEIKSLTSPGISLMPEGLEAAITPQQMADLIAHLKQ
jgi:putative membrane-bound dehydrogenase-like protein